MRRVSPECTVTVLVDNRVRAGRPEGAEREAPQGRPPGMLRAEHGLALLLERGGERILFDAGQSGLLLENARAMGVDLSGLSAAALSHGHYDHAGGFAALFAEAPPPRLYAHPGAFRKRYDARGAEIGAGWLPEAARAAGVELVLSEGPLEIAPGVFLSGAVPRANDFEDPGEGLFLDGEGCVPDPVEDDQALIVRCGEGLLVLLGCAHAGVVNTVDYVGDLFPGAGIAAVVGGMHLAGAGPKRIRETAGALEGLGASLVAAGHCTGPGAEAALASQLGERFAWLAVGMRLEL